ncbi:Aldo/keto reductase [Niveomyces insectorum RCEF 264]|uniref:Aldo/keto reductase n=1 Tax=Niveomyces insectorum RCEF 264 TaxID=1081102 RepID=A0A167MB41_9HYPO|nr:Aldo/keto reductase [Niveomyces insectorum RCEF 264]
MATSPRTRQLGRNGPRVPLMGFGLMGLSGVYGQPEPDEPRFQVLDRAYELGCRFWDSADIYFDSEDLLGKWFRRTGKRSDIFLATKFSNVADPSGAITIRSDPAYVKEACAKSLQRLGVDTIDLYYCHRVDGVTPIEKTVEAMAELKREGKIRYLGLSEVSPETLRRAHRVHPITAVQVEYSPFALEIERPETNLLATCRELGVGVVAYSPLGRGLVTGALTSPDDLAPDDFRRLIPRYSAENFPKNLELVRELQKLAAAKHCTPGQLVLAWLLRQGDDIVPIPGTKRIKYLEENWAAADVELTSAEVDAVRRAVDSAASHGDRYPPVMIDYLFGNTPAL